MAKFTDTMQINVAAGHGGAGAVSFRREKYIAKGGPDGGDGGRGGDVFIESDRRYYNLAHLFHDRIYSAEHGKPGSANHRHGADGESLTILVPPGTQVFDDDTGDLLYDLVEEHARGLVAQGGIGGKGNAFFKSSTHQTPRFSQPGMPGETATVVLNLKLIADVGLVGLPNAGKSTLLSAITNAHPKIADYPFTTLVPNLGVVRNDEGIEYTIADIPGIIEGAHRGEGLGLSFLRHIERVKIILFLIDINGDDPSYTLQLLRSELCTYNDSLAFRPNYILLTKTDTVDESTLAEKMAQLSGENVLPVSARTGENIPRLLQIILQLLESHRAS